MISEVYFFCQTTTLTLMVGMIVAFFMMPILKATGETTTVIIHCGSSVKWWLELNSRQQFNHPLMLLTSIAMRMFLMVGSEDLVRTQLLNGHGNGIADW